MVKSILFVGLDEAKDDIAVAVAEEGREGEVREYGKIPNTPEALTKLVRKLGVPKRLHFVYEAGPCGYGTYRHLKSLGAECMVVAPSKIPRRSGDRIKTDRRDAVKLARLHRAGELGPIWVPSSKDEAMRDLTRAREDAKYGETHARQRLGAFLLRHDRRYVGRSHWTRGHMRWIQEQKFDDPGQQICLEEYLKAVEEAGDRVKRLDEEIGRRSADWSLAPLVRAFQGLRGVGLITAVTLLAELGDLRRFESPRHLMAFIGLVPSLMASGLSSRSGAITKTGNGHVRRVLTESAWAYRHPARRTAHLRRRAEGLPKEIQDISWKAQVRLCGKYGRLAARGKHQNKVTTAVARELVGFLWAIAQGVEPQPGN
jgi:transposase